LHSQELVDFSLDEIHKLIVGFGIQRKSDQVLAEETQQNLELIQVRKRGKKKNTL